MKNLKNNLNNGISNFYYIFGDDILLYDKAVNMIKKASKIAMPDFNIVSFDDDNFDINKVIDTCKNLPMLDEYKIVLIKNLTKIDEKNIKTLKNYIKSPEKSTILVILDYFSKMESLKSTCIVNCGRLDNATLKGVIYNEAKRREVNIAPNNIAKLVELCNGYYSFAINELDKLSAYSDGREISSSMIDELVNVDTEYSVFELTDALGKKDAKKAIEILLKVEKDPKVFALIVNNFRRMFYVSITDKTDEELAGLFGVKEYAIKMSRIQSKNFSKIQLKKIHELLEELDFSIKNGDFSQKNMLFFLVFSILYI